MDSYGEFPTKVTKKKASRQQYVKLTVENKLEIIKYWGKYRVSIASLTERYSQIFGKQLRYRGVAEIIAYWKENGRIRGSKAETACSDVIAELEEIQSIASFYKLKLTIEDLKHYISYLSKSRDKPIEDHEYAFLQNKCLQIVKQFPIPLSEHPNLIHPLSTNEVLGLLSTYSASCVFELDVMLCLPTLFPDTSTSSKIISPSPIWTVLSLDGSSPFLPYHLFSKSIPSFSSSPSCNSNPISPSPSQPIFSTSLPSEEIRTEVLPVNPVESGERKSNSTNKGVDIDVESSEDRSQDRLQDQPQGEQTRSQSDQAATSLLSASSTLLSSSFHPPMNSSPSHNTSALADVLFHLNAFCSAPSIVLFYDLVGQIASLTMSDDQTKQIVKIRCFEHNTTVSISLTNLRLHVISRQAAWELLPMYRGLYLAFQLAFKESLLTDPSLDFSNHCDAAWNTVLSTIKDKPWGYPQRSPSPCNRTVDNYRNDIQFAPLFENYDRAFLNYKNQRLSQSEGGEDGDWMEADEYLNAEMSFAIVGKGAIMGRAHMTCIDFESSSPSNGVQNTIQGEVQGEMVERRVSHKSLRIARSNSPANELHEFMNVYRHILTTLPTTLTRDYEAMEQLQQILYNKHN